MKKYLTSLVLILSLLIVAGCGSQANSGKHKDVTIVTSISTYADIAKNIVKDHGDVEAIIHSANVDPHDFNPDTKTAKEVAEADILIANGLGYDDWILKLKDQSDLINVSKDIAKLSDGENEHVWFDIHYMKKLVKTITEEVSKKDPKHKKLFEKNSKSYLTKLDNIIAREKTLKQKLNGKRAYVSEPVFSYLLEDVGVKIENKKFAKAIEDGTDPAISDMKEMESGLRNHKVDFLVVNKQVDSNVVTKIVKIAKENNVPIIYVTETLPAKTSYVDWINGYLDKLGV
ncbi:zinc ABC transporter substrate-binding protein [Lactobacillus sp. YT155]|uniref:metal ABC transporter solute-binding protein, Zn/Mn family n=1 Tax=Lactobacillus sp. YT155 TaxID=3060955 RepID=UPI00265E9401|nr:zinc ABC transporter substrate-binding protein [Lactobacillus sp. YT155]MDO1604971.1 zinc ABC transporter substrate-binding protein [Lactobacillus sp. YT155]